MKTLKFITNTLLAAAIVSSGVALADPSNTAPASTAAQTTDANSNPVKTPPSVGTVTDTNATPASTSFSSQQVQDIQKIVHDYLVSNPQVLVEASQALQKQTAEQEQAFAQTAIKQNTQALFNDASNPVAGNTNGNVTLVEFFDYQCGHCKEMNTVIQKIIKDNQVRIVFKELPIFGDASQFAAKAALASVAQGKYVAFHDALLAADNPLNKDKVFAIAKNVGLNVPLLKKSMDSPAIQAQLRENFKLAQALHLAGTPTFVIGNKALTQFRFVPGATSEENLQGLLNEVAK